MKKKVLLISSSARIKGNSDILCDQFILGAAESNHEAEKVYIHKKNIKPCLGCDAYKRVNKGCVQKDDTQEILDKMLKSDVIVLATPIYFYSMSGQLKILLDRTYSVYEQFEKKDFYIIMTGAAPDQEYMKISLEGFNGYLSCIKDINLKGVIYGTDAHDRNSILNNDKAMKTAYEFGKSI